MKNKLGGKIMTKFVALRAKSYSYLIDDGSKDEKAKETKKCLMKIKLELENYKNHLEATKKNEIDKDIIKESFKKFVKNNKSIFKIQQRFKSERHNVFTEEVNKITLKSNDDNKIQSVHLVETYAYGTSRFSKWQRRGWI